MTQYISLHASITGYEICDPNGKKFTNFNILVKLGASQWTIGRRFTEFKELYQQIKRVEPDAIKTKFPSKFSSLTHIGDNFTPSFINQRVNTLNEFLREVLSNPRIINMPGFHEFLRIKSDEIRNATLTAGSPVSSLMNRNMSDPAISMEKEGINLGGTHNPKAKATDFEFLNQIGKGSFGRVFQARHIAEKKIYAIKVLNKEAIIRRNEVEHIMAERNVLIQNLQHPFLVGLHYSFQSKDKLYFVLDYVNGGEMFTHLKNEKIFAENRVRFYAAEISHAIGYMHSKSIIYRDLKPENILIDKDGHIKLTDFGLCKEGVKSDTTTRTFCGTPEYLAPEILQKKPYSRGVDWWTFGCVLYEMLFGWPPFYHKDHHIMYNYILYNPLRLNSELPISQEAKSILAELLRKDPQKRLGANDADFEEIRQHGFFASINWDDLVNKRIPVPWLPNLESENDLKHIDPEFTSEQVPSSLGKSMIGSSVRQNTNSAFSGFSYMPESNLK